jgi:3-oxoacyl-(acyl-carrier-protein) synthase
MGQRTFAITGSGTLSSFEPEMKIAVNVLPFLYHAKVAKTLDRRAELALVAAQQAINGSAWTHCKDPIRRGISLAVGTASMNEKDLEDIHAAAENVSLLEKWKKHLPPLWLLKQLPNMPASHLAIQFQAQGPVLTSLCGRQALVEAFDLIENGEADVMLVGAVEAPLNQGSQLALKEKFCQQIVRESAVFLVLQASENPPKAEQRGRKIVSRQDLDQPEVWPQAGDPCTQALLPFLFS